MPISLHNFLLSTNCDFLVLSVHKNEELTINAVCMYDKNAASVDKFTLSDDDDLVAICLFTIKRPIES